MATIAGKTAILVLVSAMMFTAAALPVAAEEDGVPVDSQRYLDLSAPIATVDDMDITYEEFYNTMESRIGLETLYDLILLRLCNKASEEWGVVVTDQQIEAVYQSYVASEFESEDIFLQELDRTRTNPNYIKAQIYMYLVMTELAKLQINPTEEQLRAFYVLREEEYDQDESVKLRHIVTATEEDALAVLERLDAGEDFAELAKSLSVNEPTASRGGDIASPLARSSLVSEVRDAVFAAEIGDIVGPIDVNGQWHIIEVQDQFPAKDLGFEDVSDQVLADFRANKASDPTILEEVRAQLFAGSDIVVHSDSSTYAYLVDLIDQFAATSVIEDITSGLETSGE